MLAVSGCKEKAVNFPTSNRYAGNLSNCAVVVRKPSTGRVRGKLQKAATHRGDSGAIAVPEAMATLKSALLGVLQHPALEEIGIHFARSFQRFAPHVGKFLGVGWPRDCFYRL